FCFFFSSRRRHTRSKRDWSSDVCSSDLLVSALIATYIFGLGTLAGTTAIAIFTFAYIGKILYEEIETVDMGPFEAMEAMGATKRSEERRVGKDSRAICMTAISTSAQINA